MKIVLILVGLALSLTNAEAQKYTLKGHLTNNTEQYIYIVRRTSEGKLLKDSAKIEKGQFVLSGEISEPSRGFLSFSSVSSRDAIIKSIILEPVVMEIRIKGKDLKNAIVSGSVTEQESAGIENAIKQVETETKALSAKFDKERDAYEAAVKNKAGDRVLDSLKESMAAIHDQFGPYNGRIQNLMLDFIKTHPNSYLSAMDLIYFINSLPLDTVQQLFKNLSPVIRESGYGKAVTKEIQKVIAGSPGSPAPDFSTVDINNKALQLSAFKGTYVLLDFWASWCVPCRHGNPHLIEVFNKYNSKGFTVIGVSDNDSQPDEWRKAVEKDKIGIWHHVLRGADMKKKMNGEENEADLSDKYGIHSLPTKILIDRNGVIIGRYGEGGEDEGALDKKLAEVL
jgi:thiol-disulfide isomerase/thioredoxin